MLGFRCVFFLCFQVMRSYFKRADPFFDEQVNHSLIGVANVFLSCLFYDVKLQYAIPIINQKGEVSCLANKIRTLILYKYLMITKSNLVSSRRLKLSQAQFHLGN